LQLLLPAAFSLSTYGLTSFDFSIALSSGLASRDFSKPLSGGLYSLGFSMASLRVDQAIFPDPASPAVRAGPEAVLGEAEASGLSSVQVLRVDRVSSADPALQASRALVVQQAAQAFPVTRAQVSRP